MLISSLVTVFFLTSKPNNINQNFTLADTSGDWTYTVSGNQATITQYTGSQTNVTIPSTLGGYPVLTIGNGASPSVFSGVASTLTNVTIPTSVTGINPYAFYCCAALESIELPSNVTHIGVYAFQGCNGLISATINNGIIDNYAFVECDALTTVIIGNGVTVIGAGAFYNNPSLKSITIGNNVKTIYSNAFYNCLNVTEFNFNATAMDDLSSSSSSGNSKYSFYCLGQNGAGITMNIGANVTKIPNYLFYQYNENSVYTPKITAINFENNSVCTTIGNYAFYACSSLKEVIIPDSVITIGKYSFYNSGLTHLTIGEGVTSIDSCAFHNCHDLTAINFNAIALSSGGFGDVNIGSNGPGIVATIGPNVTKIPSYLFGSSSSDSLQLTTLKFVKGSVCTTIESYAFSYCNSLTNITFGENVKSISGFDNCNGITSITMPDSVTTIGDNAFYQCSNLKDLSIGKNVTTIGNAFSYCTGLQNVIIPDNVATIGNNAFNSCSGLTSITIGEGVSTINPYAFYNCLNVTEFNFNAKAMQDLPSTSTSDDKYTFYRMGQNGSGITMTIGSNVSRIPGFLFYPYNGTTSYSPKITNVTFAPNSTCKTIGGYAFYYCTLLETITIPESVTTINGYAFRNCTSLNSVYFKQKQNFIVYSSAFTGNASTCTYYFQSQSVMDYIKTQYGTTNYFTTTNFVCQPLTEFVATAYGTVSSAGEVYPAGTSVTVTATPNAQAVFLYWIRESDNAQLTANPLTVTTSNESEKYTAVFQNATFRIMLETSGNGTISHTMVHGGTGDTQIVSATPDDRNLFLHWVRASDHQIFINNPLTVTIGNKNDTYTAIFKEWATTSVVATEDGEVTYAGGQFAPNTTFESMAYAQGGKGAFLYWLRSSDGAKFYANPLVITTGTDDDTYTAVFNELPYTHIVASNNGEVTHSGGVFAPNTMIEVIAYAPGGVGTFLYWLRSSDGAKFYSNPLMITTGEANDTYTAIFGNASQGVVVGATYGGMAAVIGDNYDNLTSNDTVTLVATVCVNGYQFSHWETTDGIILASGQNFTSWRAPINAVKDKVIIAVFERV